MVRAEKSVKYVLRGVVKSLILSICVCNATTVLAQSFTLKSNLLYDISSTINIGTEIRTADDQTFNLSVNYNPWCFSDNKKIKHLIFQSEYRFWLQNTAFSGWFLGPELHYGSFNMGGMLPYGITPSVSVAESRYQGDLTGFGISYGYQWILSSRVNIEASLSNGYTHLNYDVYGQAVNAPFVESKKYNYFGFNHIGLSIVYFLR